MDGLLHFVQRGGAWAGCSPSQSPPHCTECNSLPISGQCTNFIIIRCRRSVRVRPNALDSINVVTLRRARLMLGWVTVFGRVNHLGTEPGTAGLLSLCE